MRRSTRRTERSDVWARPAAAPLLAAGVGIIIVLHALRPDVDPARHYISEYGNEAWSWMLSAALLLIAVGLLALAASLRDTRQTRPGPRLLQLSGLLLIVMAVFSTDRRGNHVEIATLAGKLHGIAALGVFALLVLAMMMLSSSSSRGEGWRERLRPSELALPAGLMALVPPLTVFAVAPEAHGLRQRVFLLVVFSWLLVTAVQVRSSDVGRAPDVARAPDVGPSR
ncbi:MAG: DUF998 domain-containing protein [Solirubrobacteraceae bacterium]|nr:DUF998 domain-containing protein [Solirubrobacteraceae bacterium]